MNNFLECSKLDSRRWECSEKAAEVCWWSGSVHAVLAAHCVVMLCSLFVVIWALVSHCVVIQHSSLIVSSFSTRLSLCRHSALVSHVSSFSTRLSLCRHSALVSMCRYSALVSHCVLQCSSLIDTKKVCSLKRMPAFYLITMWYACQAYYGMGMYGEALDNINRAINVLPAARLFFTRGNIEFYVGVQN